MDLSNGLDSIEMVNPRIDSHLIQHRDASALDVSVEFQHGRGYIARRHNVRLPLNRRAYHVNVISERDKRDNEIVRCYMVVKVGGSDVEDDGRCARPSGCDILSRGYSSTSFGIQHAGESIQRKRVTDQW